jgi:hypothetical protein
MADIRYDRFFWTFSMAFAMLLLFADPASAQDRSRDAYGNDAATQSQDGSVGLPSWAEPGANSTSSDPGPAADPITNAPPPPGPPPRVPVDGGLALLAAAGAGYAVRRLRQGSRKDEVDEPVA